MTNSNMQYIPIWPGITIYKLLHLCLIYSPWNIWSKRNISQWNIRYMWRWRLFTRALLLGFVRTRVLIYHDRDWIIELPWRLTFCRSSGFWHQRLLASRLVSPLISRSAYAGFLSYISTTLRYAAGDGETSSWFPLLRLRHTLLCCRRRVN